MPKDKLKEIGQILSDATRVDTLRLVASSPEPVSAHEVAKSFGLHPNAARHHLAKLESAGLVRSQMRRNPNGGRPAKLYSAGRERVEIQFPARQYSLLASLILQAVYSAGVDISTALRTIGTAYGQLLGRAASKKGAPNEPLGPAGIGEIIASRSAEIGCDIKVIQAQDDFATLVNANCIFKEVAADHPEAVCGLCESIIHGIASSAEVEIRLNYEQKLALGGERCWTTLTIAKSP